MSSSIEILRFATAGSVDDGKSTLIGRLLYDSKGIFIDQLEALKNASESKNQDKIDLAHLTDGLKDEREQGITIDVAYRYFSTPKRKFIIADTPGHEEYTRNMFTGASNSDLAIILIDSERGVLKQSRRHLYISYLLGIKKIIVAVNKMDLVNYSKDRFLEIREEFTKISKDLNIESIRFIPLSALQGDMIVKRGTNLDWYKGETLIEMLENVKIFHDEGTLSSTFPVQLVSRVNNEEIKNFRGYMGMVTSGNFSIEDKIKILPTKKSSIIKKIIKNGAYNDQLNKNQSGTIVIEDELEVSRGDIITSQDYNPTIGNLFSAQICWMAEENLDIKKKYLMKHCNKSSKILVNKIINKIDIDTFDESSTNEPIMMNDIGQVEIKVQNSITYDSYGSNKILGSFIIIDIETNNTVAAGIIK